MAKSEENNGFGNLTPRARQILLLARQVAQSVEHLTFNQVVGGSNPPCLTRCCDILIWGFEPPGRDPPCLTCFFYTASSHFENPFRGFFYFIFIKERKYYAD